MFTVEFSSPSALSEFLIAVPSPLTVVGGSAGPLTCGSQTSPAPENRPNGALACTGNPNIPLSPTPINGQIQLSNPVPPNLGPNSSLYAVDGGLHGPFAMTGPGP